MMVLANSYHDSVITLAVISVITLAVITFIKSLTRKSMIVWVERKLWLSLYTCFFEFITQ